MANEQSAYNEVLYPTGPHSAATPLHLATIGWVFGMDPPAPRTAKVLEIGCGTGGFLYPLAQMYPDASFLGIDLAQVPVSKGNETIARLGLKNVTLEVGDITQFDTSRGPFDYIIAHGIYSWVSKPVRDRLLSLCGELLSPQGIAFVSYNTYPGWYLQNYARDLMRFHARSASDPKTILERAFEALQFAASTIPERPDQFAEVVKAIHQELKQVNPYYLFHDHLAEINEPVYFTQFMNHAEAYGLQYLWEATPGDRLTSGVDPDIVRQFQLPLIETEQYLDFLRNRRFRETLLCRSDVSLTREANFDRMSSLYVRGFVQSKPEVTEVQPNVPVEFHAEKGLRVNTPDSLVQATFLSINKRYPEILQIKDLVDLVDGMVRAATGLPARPTREELCADLATVIYECYLNGMMSLYCELPACTFTLSERPRADAGSRMLCQETRELVTALHQRLKLREQFVVALVAELDGEKTVEQLAQIMAEKVKRKEVELPPSVSKVSDHPTDGILTALVRSTLEQLAAEGALVG